MAWQNPTMLAERIAAYIRGETGDSFDELALAVFRSQYERIASFRTLCDQRGATPGRVAGWRDVPVAAPPAAGGTEPGAAEPPAEPDHLDLHHTVIDRSFPAACLGGMGRPPVLSLIPPGEDASDRGLGFMADRVLRVWAAPDSGVAMARRGVEVAKARGFLAARQRDRRPTLVLATSATLARLLEALDRRGLRFRLPPGSRVVEAGGRGPSDRELLIRLAEGLAVPAESVVRAYSATGLTSRFYGGHDRRGQARPFRPIPWTRVRILDPETLAEAPAGTSGLVSVFDLANVGSAAHLLTDSVGVAAEDGFQLAGGRQPG